MEGVQELMTLYFTSIRQFPLCSKEEEESSSFITQLCNGDARHASGLFFHLGIMCQQKRYELVWRQARDKSSLAE